MGSVMDIPLPVISILASAGSSVVKGESEEEGPKSRAGPGLGWAKTEVARVLGVGADPGVDGEGVIVPGSSTETTDCCESYEW